jgi:ABC-type sugar transport system substrate-binding protein
MRGKTRADRFLHRLFEKLNVSGMKRMRFPTLMVAVVLLLCAVFVFAGRTKEAPKAKAYNVGHIMPGPDPWYQTDLDEVTYCAKLVGANVVALNSELKPEKEISNVEDLISRRWTRSFSTRCRVTSLPRL